MIPDTTPPLLHLITAAVTPVVMISSDAILITGINQKHNSLSDRVRALAAEFRASGTSTERKEAIRAEVRIFARRIGYAATAHLLLYTAVVCFLAMVLVIMLAARDPAWERVGLALFVTGCALTLGAVLAELLELRLSGQTVRLEIRDVLGEDRTKR